MKTSFNVNNVHVTLDDILVRVQNSLKGTDEERKSCIEECFPDMFNTIKELQNRVVFLELKETELEDKIKELEGDG